jgi:hypothetical protein
MGKWYVSFDGRWQESFYELDQAVEWAREVAETGRTVDVAQRKLLLGRKLVAVFPESKRAEREALWSAAAFLGLSTGPHVGSGGDFGGGGGGDGGGGC